MYGHIVGLGLAVVDHVYRVDRIDLQHPRIRYTDRFEMGGGMVSTALVQAAALGCRASILSQVGADREGRQVEAWLAEAGVDTAGLLLSEAAHTTVAVVLVESDTGERRFLVADRRSLESSAPAFDLTSITRDTVLIVDGHFSGQALRALERAKQVGATVVGDFSDPRPEYLALLPFVDYPIVPYEFARAYAGDDPREALRRLYEVAGGTPVVTLGERGGVYLDGGRHREFAAVPVAAVDTTGAGDAFHGAFAVGLARGLALEVCLDLAAHAAATSCTALGGRGRLMTRGEMLALTGGDA